jgi:hypothetical protein
MKHMRPAVLKIAVIAMRAKLRVFVSLALLEKSASRQRAIGTTKIRFQGRWDIATPAMSIIAMAVAQNLPAKMWMIQEQCASGVREVVVLTMMMEHVSKSAHPYVSSPCSVILFFFLSLSLASLAVQY